MNYELLRKSFEDSSVVLMGNAADGTPLVTNGHILCRVPADFTIEQRHYSIDPKDAAGQRRRLPQLWQDCLVDGAQRACTAGDAVEVSCIPYARRLQSDATTIVINEKYFRLFQDSAEWLGTRHDEKLVVKENGEVTAVIMPLRIEATAGKVIEPPSEEDLYPRRGRPRRRL